MGRPIGLIELVDVLSGLWVVGIRVRLGWDEWTDRAREPLNRSPVDQGSLRSLWKSTTNDGLGLLSGFLEGVKESSGASDVFGGSFES